MLNRCKKCGNFINPLSIYGNKDYCDDCLEEMQEEYDLEQLRRIRNKLSRKISILKKENLKN